MKSMLTRRSLFLVITALTLVSLTILTACSPGDTATPAGPDLQATIEILQTQVAHAAQPTAVPTAPPTDTPPAKPSPTPDEIQSDYAGFMVFADQQFIGYDFNGNGIGFKVAAPGVEGLSLYGASVFADGLVHAYAPDMQIRLVTAQETSTLDFISMENPVNVVISPDGSKIAWAYQFFGGDAPGAELWVANVDGSEAQKIDEILPENNAERWLVLRPVEWTRDGKLLYATQLTGIGGYILYGGWNSLSLYDPADGSLTVLVEDEPSGMCVNSLSADRSLAALGCDQIHIRRLADGHEITLPKVLEQNVAGSAHFSPSGALIAYAIARSDPENERSQMFVAPSDGSGDMQPLQTMEGGDFHILGWINEDSLLFSAHEMASNRTTIWRIDRDGSRPTQLIEAQFLGFMPK